MKKYFLIMTLFSFCACTTVEFVRKDLTPRKEGILRHNPASSPERETEYREKVNAKAREFCGGDFTITREYEALAEARTTAGIGTGVGIGSRGSVTIGGIGPSESTYHFTEFICN
ncbi:MAG: hypothetical protein ACAH59_02545 [Pseudobdellovibrionaceae bacterium]